MKIGYARVSTQEQSLLAQLEELQRAGCEKVYREKASGAEPRRELNRLLKTLMPGDVLVVCKLDRLARSAKGLLELVAQLTEVGATFRSLGEPWADTSSPAGTLIMTVFAGIAEFERGRMIERCNDGRVIAKRDGVKFGRKPKLSYIQIEAASKMLDEGARADRTARLFNVDRKTLRRAVAKYKDDEYQRNARRNGELDAA
jgi:DNA invertase Pin-like site-specific DNA recombinase